MGVQVTNNAWGELSVPLTAEGTLLLLSGGQGDRFPQASEGTTWFYVTIVDSENNLEIVKCTARTGDTLTILRGTDGTQARAFREGCRVELRPTAALFNDKASKDEVKSSLDALEKALKEADSKDFTALENLIDDVKKTYLTKEDFEAEMKKKDESNTDSFLTQEDAKKTYVPIEGGTMTGTLRVEPTTGMGLIIKSSVGAGINVEGGDLTLTTYKDSVSGRTYGGNVTAGGTIKGQTVRSTSDARMKNSIVGFHEGEGAELVKKLRPVHFKWNTTGDDDVGLIAQEVAKVLPEVVGGGDLLSVNYSALVAVVMAAVQDLTKKVEDIECRIK